MTYVHDEENTLIGKAYSECQDLASRLAGSYAGIARNKNKPEILKIIHDDISFAFADLPKQLSFLEAALLPFVSKLSTPDIPDMYVSDRIFSGAAFDFFTNYPFHCSLTDVEKRKTQDTNVNGDQSAWVPYFAFANKLEET
jgi:cohesin complex subunit SA-1/2